MTKMQASAEGFAGLPWLCTDRYIYAVTKNGRWLLFDNTSYPYQLKNLAGMPPTSS